MLEPTVPASVVPYYGPWTVLNSAGETLLTAPTQEEALRSAKQDLPEGAILAIDAASCVIRYINPAAIARQISPGKDEKLKVAKERSK